MMSRYNPHILHRNFILLRYECAHSLVGTILRRRLADEYLQSALLVFLDKLLSRIRPYLYSDECLIAHEAIVPHNKKRPARGAFC